ncbi:MAG: aldehyde dehydrogenase family protein, partial [Pseudomonadota bacterium]
MPSERKAHRLMELWHPLGVCGIITAFNFPVAVWAWNSALALVCGNSVVWKPSEKTPLSALAAQALLERAMVRFAKERPESLPPGLSQVVLGGAEQGKLIAHSPRVALVSATGSVPMGHAVGMAVAGRFGRSILELGGNNGIIVGATADLDLAAHAITFSAAGTAGQRCTSARRLIVHRSVADVLFARLKNIYATLVVGDPLEAETLVGPLIDAHAYRQMQAALECARAEGGEVFGGERVCQHLGNHAYYARPALVRMPGQTPVMHRETFAPILYVVAYDRLEQAIDLNNAVPQGLSSAIITNDLRETEVFLSVLGSDCGIANVNMGTSGAEIGGAFGGEKETGGGRESGSDAWKAYMRRSTSAINHS